MKVKININQVIQTFCAIYCLLWLFGGIFDFLSFLPQPSVYIAFILWLLIAIGNKRNFINGLFTTGWPIYLLLIINTFALLINPDQYFINNETVFMYICIVHSIYIYYSFEDEILPRKIIFIALCIDVAIIGISTASALQINPNVARYLGAGIDRYSQIVELQNKLGQLNIAVSNIKAIGSYGYFNSFIFIQIVLVLAFIKQNAKWKKMIIGVIVVFSILLSINASFVTASILSIISMVMLLLTNKIKNKNERLLILFSVLLLIIIMVILGILPSIISAVSNSINNATVSDRLNEIVLILRGEFDLNGDLSSRVTLAEKSIVTFCNHPFLGCILGGTEGNIGGHATGFDMLGIYGVSGALFIAFWIKITSAIKRKYSKYNAPIFQISFVCFFVLMFMNSLLAVQLYIAYMIFIPFGTEVICKKSSCLTTGASSGDNV